jgi:hypothetical protein
MKRLRWRRELAEWQGLSAYQVADTQPLLFSSNLENEFETKYEKRYQPGFLAP